MDWPSVAFGNYQHPFAVSDFVYQTVLLVSVVFWNSRVEHVTNSQLGLKRTVGRGWHGLYVLACIWNVDRG